MAVQKQTATQFIHAEPMCTFKSGKFNESLDFLGISQLRLISELTGFSGGILAPDEHPESIFAIYCISKNRNDHLSRNTTISISFQINNICYFRIRRRNNLQTFYPLITIFLCSCPSVFHCHTDLTRVRLTFLAVMLNLGQSLFHANIRMAL